MEVEIDMMEDQQSMMKLLLIVVDSSLKVDEEER